MKSLLRSAFAAFVVTAIALPAWAGDPIRKITVLSRPQAGQQAEFQSVQLIAQEWRKLGLDVEVRAIPWEQMSDEVWYKRDQWDSTAWQMVGRPERSDPDELIFNLFHSSTARDGYNFAGYLNKDYDATAEAQRGEIDPAKRKALVFKAQEILSKDQPYMMLVHPKSTFAFDKTVWKPESVVNQSGIGIRNTWTFLGVEPAGAKKDLIINSSDNIKAINPLYISGSVDSWITELVWDRLLRVGPDGLPKAWAAESFTWKDGTTVDVKLKSGMKWHDGKPVTPDDVKFSFEAAVGGEAPMYKPFATNIDSITTNGDAITFKLKKPAASFVTSSLAKVNLIPKHIWEPILKDLAAKPETAESYQEQMPIGSGPFKFTSWAKNESVTLAANKDHFAAPKVDRWILRIVPNAEAALGMLRSGEINFMGEFTGDPQVLIDAAKKDGDLEVVSTVDMGFRYIAFNERRAPFNDPAFRRALSEAVDRQLIVKAAYKSFAVGSNSIVSPALEFWHDKSVVDSFKTGQAVAAKTLKDAGYTLEGGKLRYPGDTKETIAAK
ncbi:ABC transporter substrate-binding protein [Neorhizobium tomejilense]|uniref:ABC transporter substrate-binding protein n=1 Tax=Neorhizobium tomejilense TaxID=2093828 RepID=UPI000CF98FE7|nr:ABC transporter substrate-binding protein [Neorhizobium tomejilense]